ncbi:MAG TPA: nucleotide exchange factor GrpE [Pyrinomonadaceae bacterium]|nr:nucleotide exchange factor GrpE [Pyrinomonadaceae bacterium]
MDTNTVSSETNLPDNNEDSTPRPITELATPISVEPEPAAETSGEHVSLTVLNERIETLAALLEETNRLSNERERIIDRLHQENQSLKQGELQQALLPVLRDSIRLFDDLNKTAKNYATRENLVPANVAHDFQCFADTVSDILYRHGVDRYTAGEGDAFNSKEHRVLGVVQTSEKEKDRTIARTIHEGFRSNLAIVRLLEAEVYKYVSDAARENNPPVSASQ